MKLTTLVAMLCWLPACGGDDDTASLPRQNLGISAGYELVTRVELTATNVLPEPALEYVKILRELRDDPGAAFFDLLDQAGVPLVDELRAALPDVVEDRVAGWISAAIPAPAKAKIDELLVALDSPLARFDLHSLLDLPEHDGAGRARATHSLTSVGIAGRTIAIPPVATVTSVAVDATLSAGVAPVDARLLLAQHAFGLAYGERLYDLLELLARERNPGGLRAYLGEVVNCPAVAAEVAHKCVLSVCVGHETELDALCERGLDEAVEALHEKLASLRFDAIRFDKGEGDMLDSSGDDLIDSLTGRWQAQLNLGMGLRPVTATFTGTRR